MEAKSRRRFSTPPFVLRPCSVRFERSSVVLALAFLWGCSGSAIVAQGPSDALRSYSLAIQQGRVDDAYRLLSDDAKRTMSLEAFRRAVKENPADAIEIAEALARPSGDPVITAFVTMPNGDELV